MKTVMDVVHSLLELYPGFADSTGDNSPMLKCLEARWSACEQPLFLLSYFLHPVHKTKAVSLLHATPLTWSLLLDFAVYYYRRFLSAKCGSLRADLFNWLFSSIGSCEVTEFQNWVYGYWRYVKGLWRHEKLAELSRTVLSIAVNTVTCERLFSELALIHTRTRNRMAAVKARHIHVARKWVRRNSDSNNGDDTAVHPHRILDPHEWSLISTPQKALGGRAQDAVRSSLQLDLQPTQGSEAAKTGVSEADSPCSPTETVQFWDELIDEIFDSVDDGDGVRHTSSAVDAKDPIPEARKDLFPASNESDFPQEKFAGIRT